MPIVVPSPHSGQPVKVRDEDVGRAVRDETGRIFYVLPKSDGDGYYGAVTRTGSKPGQPIRPATPSPAQEAVASSPSASVVHDATGTQCRRRFRIVPVLVLLLLLIGLLALVVWGPLRP